MKHSILIACFTLLAVSTTVGQQSDDQLAQEWQNASAIPTDNCTVEPSRQLNIAVGVNGTLTKLEPGRRGGVVKKGQLVVEIESSLAQAELDQLKHTAKSTVAIKFAQQSIDSETLRLTEMKEQNIAADSEVFTPNEIREQQLVIVKSKAELEKAEEEKVGAELAAKTKEIELKQYTKYAEIDGIVTDLHSMSVGTSIRQGDPIMTIVDYDEMIVKMEVDPQYEEHINVGDRVIVKRTSSLPTPAEPQKRAPRGNGNIFGNTSTPAIKTSASTRQGQDYYFEGEVTFTSGQVKSGSSSTARRIVIEAVVKNKLAGKGNYLLKEGVKIDAVILAK